MTNVLTTTNSGWSTSSGASVANYYMPAVGSTSSTVYTVGDGDGLYSSTTIDDWTRNSVARGFRIYNFLEDECANFYQQKYITMNAHWFDIKNSSDGTDNGNSNIEVIIGTNKSIIKVLNLYPLNKSIVKKIVAKRIPQGCTSVPNEIGVT